MFFCHENKMFRNLYLGLWYGSLDTEEEYNRQTERIWIVQIQGECWMLTGWNKLELQKYCEEWKKINTATSISWSRYEKRQIQIAAINNARNDPRQEKRRKKTDLVVEQLKSLLVQVQLWFVSCCIFKSTQHRDVYQPS